MRNILLLGLIYGFCLNARADWEKLGPAGGYLRTMTVAPSDDAIIYAATFTEPCQIIKSADTGNSWNRTSRMSDYVFSLAVDPTNPDIVYAGSNLKIYKSIDGGNTWTSHAVSDDYLYCIRVHPNSPSTIFAAGAVNVGGTNYMGFFKSTNGGVNWNSTQLYSSSSCSYSLAVDPSNPDNIFVGGSILSSITPPKIYKSTDGGMNFTEVTSGIILGYAAHSLVVHPTNSNIIYLGTDVGVYRSINGGSNWSLVDTLGNIYSLATSPADPYIVYAGADTNVFKSTNEGGSWFNPGPNISGREIRGLEASRTQAINVYAGNVLGFLKSTNGGLDWIESNYGINAMNIDNFAVAPSTPSIIYMEIDDVARCKSTNSGSNWTLLPAILDCGKICAFTIHNSDPDIVLALEGTG